jgi:hypothetical protein
MTAQAIKTQRKRKIDVSRAITDVVERNLTYEEAGKLQGTSKQAIHYAIKDLLPPKEIATFKDKRADILAYTQYKDLAIYLALDPDERKSLILKRGLVDLGISYDKERIERGHSSEGKPLVIINRISVNTGSDRVTNVTDIEQE